MPSAFSPRTGMLYIPAHNTCMDYEGVAVNYIAGTPYLGASVRMYPGDGRIPGRTGRVGCGQREESLVHQGKYSARL